MSNIPGSPEFAGPFLGVKPFCRMSTLTVKCVEDKVSFFLPRNSKADRLERLDERIN